MAKIKLWFVYEDVTSEGKLSKMTKEVIQLINLLKRTYDKKMFDLRSIEYSRFLSETHIALDKNDLPATIINDKVAFTKKLPLVDELKKKISELKGE